MPPYHSRGNGQVERFNHTIKLLLRQTLFTVPTPTMDTVRQLLTGIQLALNVTTHRAIGCPPYLVMFGTMPSVVPGTTPPPPLSADPSKAEVTAYVQHL